MAKRLMLTILALLAGLFAQTAPAQARTCAPAATEIGIVLPALKHTVRCLPGVVAKAQTRYRAETARDVPVRAGIAVSIPAVRMPIDRARE